MREEACSSSCFIDGEDVSAAACLQLRLFDLLSLEDVQYLSVQFPIIPPLDWSNTVFFFFSFPLPTLE